MVDTKTSAETAATALTGAELFRGVQGGSNMKATADQIRKFTSALPEYVAGNWYFAGPPGARNSAGTALSVTLTYFFPFLVRERCTIDSLGLSITTLGTSNVQMALVASDVSIPNRPGVTLSNSASVVDTATGAITCALGASQQLLPGLYWVALQVNDTTMMSLGVEATTWNYGNWIGSSSLANVLRAVSNQTLGLTAVSVFGTWPDFTGATFTELTVPRTGAFAFHVASVP